MLLIFTYRYNEITAYYSWVFSKLGAQHLFFLFVGYLTLDLWFNQDCLLRRLLCSLRFEYRVYEFESRVSTFISYLFQCEVLLGV